MANVDQFFPHWEALTPETRLAFDKIATLELVGRFYLAGGSGLALHLGHRFSVDLDFFSPASDAVGFADRAALHAALDDPSLTITLDQEAAFVAGWRGVGLSFLRLDEYPLVKPPLRINGVPLATLEEIGAMKLAAIIDRGNRKDLVDLYFILQQVHIER
jgi:hypothetical protein